MPKGVALRFCVGEAVMPPLTMPPSAAKPPAGPRGSAHGYFLRSKSSRVGSATLKKEPKSVLTPVFLRQHTPIISQKGGAEYG